MGDRMAGAAAGPETRQRAITEYTDKRRATLSTLQPLPEVGDDFEEDPTQEWKLVDSYRRTQHFEEDPTASG